MKYEQISLRLDPMRVPFEMPIQDQRHSARRAVKVLRSSSSDCHFRRSGDFGNENLAQLRIGLDQQEIIRALQRQRPLNTCLYFRERVSILAQVSEKTPDELIEREPVFDGLVVSRSHVNAASLA